MTRTIIVNRKIIVISREGAMFSYDVEEYSTWLKKVLKIKQCRDCIFFKPFKRREKIEKKLGTGEWGLCEKRGVIVQGGYTCYESEH